MSNNDKQTTMTKVDCQVDELALGLVLEVGQVSTQENVCGEDGVMSSFVIVVVALSLGYSIGKQ